MPMETSGDPSFGNMVRQMNKLMDQLQKGFYNFCPAETWTPTVNLYENDQSYLVCVDLSGVDKSKIDLTIVDGQLKLRGQRTVPLQPETDPDSPQPRIKVHLMEIDHGPFCREVDLPNDVDQDSIHASYLNGMLWVEIPKKTGGGAR